MERNSSKNRIKVDRNMFVSDFDSTVHPSHWRYSNNRKIITFQNRTEYLKHRGEHSQRFSADAGEDVTSGRAFRVARTYRDIVSFDTVCETFAKKRNHPNGKEKTVGRRGEGMSKISPSQMFGNGKESSHHPPLHPSAELSSLEERRDAHGFQRARKSRAAEERNSRGASNLRQAHDNASVARDRRIYIVHASSYISNRAYKSSQFTGNSLYRLLTVKLALLKALFEIYLYARCVFFRLMKNIWNYFPFIVTNLIGRMSLSAPVKIYAGRGNEFFSKVDFKSAHFIVSSLYTMLQHRWQKLARDITGRNKRRSASLRTNINKTSPVKNKRMAFVCSPAFMLRLFVPEIWFQLERAAENNFASIVSKSAIANCERYPAFQSTAGNNHARENPPTSDIVRHDSQLRKSGFGTAWELNPLRLESLCGWIYELNGSMRASNLQISVQSCLLQPCEQPLLVYSVVLSRSRTGAGGMGMALVHKRGGRGEVKRKEAVVFQMGRLKWAGQRAVTQAPGGNEKIRSTTTASRLPTSACREQRFSYPLPPPPSSFVNHHDLPLAQQRIHSFPVLVRYISPPPPPAPSSYQFLELCAATIAIVNKLPADVRWFFRGSPVYPALAFRRCSMLNKFRPYWVSKSPLLRAAQTTALHPQAGPANALSQDDVISTTGERGEHHTCHLSPANADLYMPGRASKPGVLNGHQCRVHATCASRETSDCAETIGRSRKGKRSVPGVWRSANVWRAESGADLVDYKETGAFFVSARRYHDVHFDMKTPGGAYFSRAPRWARPVPVCAVRCLSAYHQNWTGRARPVWSLLCVPGLTFQLNCNNLQLSKSATCCFNASPATTCHCLRMCCRASSCKRPSNEFFLRFNWSLIYQALQVPPPPPHTHTRNSQVRRGRGNEQARAMGPPPPIDCSPSSTSHKGDLPMGNLHATSVPYVDATIRHAMREIVGIVHAKHIQQDCPFKDEVKQLPMEHCTRLYNTSKGSASGGSSRQDGAPGASSALSLYTTCLTSCSFLRGWEEGRKNEVLPRDAPNNSYFRRHAKREFALTCLRYDHVTRDPSLPTHFLPPPPHHEQNLTHEMVLPHLQILSGRGKEHKYQVTYPLLSIVRDDSKQCECLATLNVEARERHCEEAAIAAPIFPCQRSGRLLRGLLICFPARFLPGRLRRNSRWKLMPRPCSKRQEIRTPMHSHSAMTLTADCDLGVIPSPASPHHSQRKTARLFRLAGAYLYTPKCGTKYQEGARKYKEFMEHARQNCRLEFFDFKLKEQYSKHAYIVRTHRINLAVQLSGNRHGESDTECGIHHNRNRKFRQLTIPIKLINFQWRYDHEKTTILKWQRGRPCCSEERRKIERWTKKRCWNGVQETIGCQKDDHQTAGLLELTGSESPKTVIPGEDYWNST
ncbi:hypothetical protein PR048_032326 [Dryococelus australis]|uniref:Uncharacterized protein n=1 Tax=Dryococelus australis TaxID=614101 RepID=A0ABQ9G1W6_9NEOP|nr:hypothetical protein PR048_032326 [Dryococelus australis]